MEGAPTQQKGSIMSFMHKSFYACKIIEQQQQCISPVGK